MLIIDLVLLVVGAAMVVGMDPRTIRRVAAVATWAVIGGLIVLALNGFPLMRKRVGRSDVALAPRAESQALGIHRYVGFATEGCFSFAWPSLLGFVFRVPRSRLRRGLVLIGATLLFVAFALVAVSAYMLPHTGSVVLPSPLAATILRFAILHVTIGPALAGLLIVALALSLRESRVAAGFRVIR